MPKPKRSQPLASRVVQRLITPIEKFLKQDTSAGVVLLLATAVAMIWANSPWVDIYKSLIEMPISLKWGHLF